MLVSITMFYADLSPSIIKLLTLPGACPLRGVCTMNIGIDDLLFMIRIEQVYNIKGKRC